MKTSSRSVVLSPQIVSIGWTGLNSFNLPRRVRRRDLQDEARCRCRSGALTGRHPAIPQAEFFNLIHFDLVGLGWITPKKKQKLGKQRAEIIARGSLPPRCWRAKTGLDSP
jgi:hypothetical protein